MVQACGNYYVYREYITEFSRRYLHVICMIYTLLNTSDACANKYKYEYLPISIHEDVLGAFLVSGWHVLRNEIQSENIARIDPIQIRLFTI